MIGKRAELRALAALLLAGAGACATPPPAPAPLPALPAGHELVLAGERVPIDAPVVLWTEEPFYDAYREGPRFAAEGKAGPRCRRGREARTPELAARVELEGWTRADLREQVDQFVIHYDVCGTSRTCFRVLQDERQLSVHFLLDVDGTLYQTLDLSETAWHARTANPRSIGVEIANVGAYPAGERARLLARYEWSEAGVRLALTPAERAGLRWPAFPGAPARARLVVGPIHGARLEQFDFTPEQYRSLAALAAALAREFPAIALDAPRDAEGHVRTDALSDEEEAHFHGVLGHYHLQTDKSDPGPAFDWERFLAEARAGSTPRP